jgi:hypothetical protein
MMIVPDYSKVQLSWIAANRIEIDLNNVSREVFVFSYGKHEACMRLDWNLGALADGLRCYRSQEFFLAHEHWESVWLKCQEPEKSFLQALIQMAAAFHHLQRNNSSGTASLLKSALRRLEPYPAIFEGVDVAPLREELGAWLRMLEVHDSPIHALFPQIQLVPSEISEGEKAES